MDCRKLLVLKGLNHFTWNTLSDKFKGLRAFVLLLGTQANDQLFKAFWTLLINAPTNVFQARKCTGLLEGVFSSMQ